MYRRICLFGLPRCGSQYIAELIKENSSEKITDMYETYTEGQPLPVITNHKLHMEFLKGYDKSPHAINKRIYYIYIRVQCICFH